MSTDPQPLKLESDEVEIDLEGSLHGDEEEEAKELAAMKARGT